MNLFLRMQLARWFGMAATNHWGILTGLKLPGFKTRRTSCTIAVKNKRLQNFSPLQHENHLTTTIGLFTQLWQQFREAETEL